MSIPVLTYPSSSQNQRVAGFEIPGDEHPRLYSTDNLLSGSELDNLIAAAYRQIFNEQQMTQSSRQVALESQLRAGHITVKEFIRGLATSDVFRTRNYDTNNNYRLAQMCVQRILGRDVYDNREKLAWSIVLATKGLRGFVNTLLNSEEYVTNFGDNTVPYQRRRILPQRTQGNLPFARMARYDEYYRANLPQPSLRGGFGISSTMSPVRWDWQKQTPSAARGVGTAIAYAGGAALALLVLSTFLSFVGVIHL
jgi:phycobilisome rod-core linker protein